MPLRRALACFSLWLWMAACGGPQSDSPPPDTAAVAGGERVTVEAQVRPGLLEMRRWREPRERIVIDRSGVLLGPVGSPPVRKLFTDPDRLLDFLSFLRTYAPFRLRSGDRELAFGGQGTVKPGPVEQRMILEWARGVAAEASSGGSIDTYGLILAWHRGGAAGGCDNVVVYLDGEVRASACADGGDELRGRLRPEHLARVYNWYDHLKPLQVTVGGDGGGGQVPARLTFAGRGTREPGPEEITALQGLSAGLHRELLARYGRLPAPVPVPQPANGKKKGQTAPAPPPEAPALSLLVPPAPPARLPAPRAVLPRFVLPPPLHDGDAPVNPPGADGVR